MAEPGGGDDSRLAELAAAAIDGKDVDWATASASSDSDAPGPGVLRELEIIAKIGNLLRLTGIDPEAVTPHSSGATGAVEPMVAPAGTATPGTATSGPAPAIETAPAAPAGSVGRASWGPLRIIREVGQGSFGRVFRAVDTRLDRTVALKLFETVRSDNAPKVVPEARLLAQVGHENVVTVFGADLFDGAAGLWMEFINGRTLRQLCDEQDPFSAAEAVLVGLDVCRALAAVHRAGLVHGDIKAQNVMREVGGRIVLTDFGAARLIRFAPNPRPVTAAPYYAAPELFLGAQPTVRSDLYSLGVLLYFLVTGCFPVSGCAPGDILGAHVVGQRTRLRDLRPDLPSSFIHVVDTATALLPEDRPDSAGALEALLERATGRVSTVSLAHRNSARGDTAAASIAVLPFADLSDNRSLGHFCEGLAEEIIDTLSTIAGLHVVPRTSAFTVPDRRRTARRVGSALNVRHVLQGSVRSSGTRLRVAARLTDAITGVQVWSHRFDRELADVFGVQEEIAAAACRELGVQLRRSAETAPTAGPSSKSEAYTLYLKGRYCWNRRTELSLQKSVSYFQAAIDKDPDYGLAYAALAEATTTLGLYGVLAPHDVMPRARAAARRAIELTGQSSGAHATAACIAAVYDWDWASAARAYHRAMAINPDDPSPHHWYAINYLVPLRRFEEAAAELQLAADADPLSMPIRASFGLRSYFAHEYPRAEGELRECLDMDGGATTARLFLGLTLVETGRFDDAIAELEVATQVSPSPEVTAALGYACARAGRRERARGLLGDLLLQSEQRYVSPSLVAQVHAGFGSTEPALEHLERAADAHAADLAWLGVRPVFDSLRAEARFEALIARIQGCRARSATRRQGR
jgi:serine/threonine-protein kinase